MNPNTNFNRSSVGRAFNSPWLKYAKDLLFYSRPAKRERFPLSASELSLFKQSSRLGRLGVRTKHKLRMSRCMGGGYCSCAQFSIILCKIDHFGYTICSRSF